MSSMPGTNSDNQKLLTDALLAIKKAQHKLQLLEAEKSEPIAIIGASCRFPGKVNDLESFHHFLSAGQDGITDFPEDRWDQACYRDDRTTPGKICVCKAGIIENPDRFDAGFFRISPKEAEKMDPQQRLLLELAWESLEKANILPESLYTQPVGVFVGISTSDYLSVQSRLLHESEINGYVAMGSSHSIAAGRLSYYLGLKGPCVALDTACSSSLTAMHYACESLRKKECQLALVGGVNLLLEPLLTLAFSQAGMLSPDGYCKTFDESANGYVRSEGGGMLVVKRLSDAVADGDHILAKVLGSAINHNGPSGGLTVPSGTAQQALIQQALKNAKIEASAVSYIEAHGTGTYLGDPIEINALQQVFSKSHGPQTPLYISTVKTNLGHLEAAAGVASILKVVCQFGNQEIYPHLHLQNPNTHIAWDTIALKIPTEKMAWEAYGKKRVAGVSSFGVNGSNAHLILEEYLPTQASETFTFVVDQQHPVAIPLSARNRDRLLAYARRLLQFIEGENTQAQPNFLANLAYTLQTGREAMEERAIFLVSGIVHLKQVLAQYCLGSQSIPACYQGKAKKGFAALGEREQHTEAERMDQLAERWVKGETVDWSQLYPAAKPTKISIPTYPFAGERYWAPIQRTTVDDSKIDSTFLHPLVHSNVSDLYAQMYKSVFTGAEPFLQEHTIQGIKVLPGAAYLEMALAAGSRALRQQVNLLSEITWAAPLIVQDIPKEVFITLYPENSRLAFNISSKENNDSILHCKGYVSQQNKPLPKIDVQALLASCQHAFIEEQYTEWISSMGMASEPFFRYIECIRYTDTYSIAVIRKPALAEGYYLHPGQLNASIQSVIGVFPDGIEKPALQIPLRAQEFRICGDPQQIRYAYARLLPVKEADVHYLHCAIDWLTEEGKVVMHSRNFVSQRINQLTDAAHSRLSLDLHLSAAGLGATTQYRVLAKRDLS